MSFAASGNRSSRSVPEVNAHQNSSGSPEIPEFVALAVSLGVPFIAAERLWARIVVTLAEMDLGKITDEQAAARIDRLAGLVFMAARGSVQ